MDPKMKQRNWQKLKLKQFWKLVKTWIGHKMVSFYKTLTFNSIVKVVLKSVENAEILPYCVTYLDSVWEKNKSFIPL